MGSGGIADLTDKSMGHLGSFVSFFYLVRFSPDQLSCEFSSVDLVQHYPRSFGQDNPRMHYLCLHGAIGNIEVCEKLSGCLINTDSRTCSQNIGIQLGKVDRDRFLIPCCLN